MREGASVQLTPIKVNQGIEEEMSSDEDDDDFNDRYQSEQKQNTGEKTLDSVVVRERSGSTPQLVEDDAPVQVEFCPETPEIGELDIDNISSKDENHPLNHPSSVSLAAEIQQQYNTIQNPSQVPCSNSTTK